MLNVIFYLKVDLCKFVRSKMRWESAKVEKKICLVKTDYRWCAALSWKWGSNVAFMAIVRFFPKIQLKNWCPCVTLTTCKISRNLSVTDKQRFRALCPNACKNAPFWNKWKFSWKIWQYCRVSSTISQQHIKFKKCFQLILRNLYRHT